jgi:PKD repeat protein
MDTHAGDSATTSRAVTWLGTCLYRILFTCFLSAAVSAQFAADFTATPTAGVNPLVVSFTDTSTGDGLFLWTWDFGDGSTSTAQHPVHAYDVAESTSFTVSLTVVNGAFQSDIETKVDFITVDPAPLVADFSASPAQGVNPLLVDFTDLSTGATITAWSWDFGDGAVSTLQNPQHTYKVAASTDFTVSLTASVGPQDETVVKTDLITVDPAPLVVDFTATPVQGVNPLQVMFTDTSTGAGVTAWSWELGDGAMSSQQHPVHLYDAPGTYSVSLTASVGPQSGMLVMTDLVTVDPAPLIADFTASPTLGPSPLTVSFTDTSSGGDVTAWSWDFGDGVTSTDQNPTHTYYFLGTYDVSLEASIGQQSEIVARVDLVTVNPATLAVPLFNAQSFVVGSGPISVEVGDYNSDGTADLATADSTSNTVSILLGQGTGGFASRGSNVVGSTPYSVAVGDFDGDGAQDLVTANLSSDSVSVLLSQGDGGFAPERFFDTGRQPRCVAVADINGDGVLDLVTADDGNIIQEGHTPSGDVTILLGQGDGNFTLGGSLDVGIGLYPVNSVAAGDFDMDGSLDLATANAGTSKLDNPTLGVLLGQGDGSFQTLFGVVLSYTSGPWTVVLADFTGDGELDVAVESGNTVRILRGVGDGQFQSGSVSGVGTGPRSIAVGDFDGDETLDLVTADYSADTVTILLGEGAGGFAFGRSYNVGKSPHSVAVADFDGDGTQDLVTANSGSGTVTVLRGQGNGGFLDNLSVPVGVDPQSVAVGDFDADGIQDLVTANAFSSTVSILLGQGNGSFTNNGPFGVGAQPVAVAVEDFNGDGKPDLVTANKAANRVGILLAEGNGNFSMGGSFDVGVDPVSVATGDFNGDGTLDLATADSGSDTVSILIGHRDGGFVSGVTPGVGTSPSDVAVGDLDDNGALDLVTADSDADTVSILLGQGDGSFVSGGAVGVGSNPTSVAVGDVDDDGVQDVATADTQGGTVSILLGQGDGSFSAPAFFVVGALPRSVSLADINGDGHTDLATVHEDLNTVRVLLGDGSGNFTINGFFGVGSSPQSLAVGDFNGDGKTDLVTANAGSATVSILLNQLDVWINLGSGLPGVTGIPSLAGTGTLETGSAGTLVLSNAAPSSTALIAASLTSTPTQFLCGVLVPFPIQFSVLTQTDGDGEIPLGWPSWPAGLSGQSLYLQAAIVDAVAPCGVSLSNALRADVP